MTIDCASGEAKRLSGICFREPLERQSKAQRTKRSWTGGGQGAQEKAEDTCAGLKGAWTSRVSNYARLG